MAAETSWFADVIVVQFGKHDRCVRRIVGRAKSLKIVCIRCRVAASTKSFQIETIFERIRRFDFVASQMGIVSRQRDFRPAPPFGIEFVQQVAPDMTPRGVAVAGLACL